MSKKLFILFFSCNIILNFCGCASLEESLKKVWGSSTQALEEARHSAVKKKFNCRFEECFNAILRIADEENPVQDDEIKMKGMGKKEEPDHSTSPASAKDEVVKTRKNYDIFIKDYAHRHFVVMNVPGAVDTTEVGIFLIPENEQLTRIEVSSLSTSAKVKISEIIFTNLAKTFKEVP